MKSLSLLVEVGFQQDFIDLFLCFTEDDGSAMSAAIKIDEVGNN